MSKFGGFVSLIGGAATLVGYFVESLGTKYYLVLAGGIVAVIGALISFKSRYRDRI